MNCANHPDRERVAFCQNCGKPLCQECVRNVGTAVLCEPCLAQRTTATGPGYAYGVPPQGVPLSPNAPNPTLAALLGLIPGVGAMYNEQYAKGIVHLVVFAVLVSLSSDVNGLFGLFVAGWICYMAIEAHHTARAKRDGTPLPNPFGLNDIGERLGFGKAWPSGSATPTGTNPVGTPPPASTYGAPVAGFYPEAGAAHANPYAPPASHWGAPQDYTQTGYVPPVPPVPQGAPYVDPALSTCRRFPTGAIWLIGLGAFFLLSHAGLRIFPGRLLAPFVLIGLGVMVFVKRMTNTGYGLENDGTDHYRWRLANAVQGAMWLVLIGVIMLLNESHIMRWRTSWPLFLIGAGVLLVVRNAMGGSFGPMPPYPPPGPAATPPSPSPSGHAITTTHPETHSNEEGR